MIMSFVRKRCWMILLAVAAGCGQPEARERAGKVSLALTAPGPDGDTYRLPDRSSMEIRQDGEWVDEVDIAGPEANKVFSLAVGSYSGRVREYNVGADPAGVSWQILRVNPDSSTTPVPATLQEPNPTFDVQAGLTTRVALRFTVHGVGDVVFVTGKVDLGIDVATDTLPAASAQWLGSLAVASQSLNGSAGLNGALMAAPGTAVPLDIKVKLSETWVHHLDYVCNAFSELKVVARGTHDGLKSWLSEVVPATLYAQVCIYDDDFVYIDAERLGPATSPLGMHLSGDHDFYLTLWGQGPAGLWDGTTLAVSKLAESTTLTYPGAYLGLHTGPPAWDEIASTTFTASSLTVKFVP